MRPKDALFVLAALLLTVSAVHAQTPPDHEPGWLGETPTFPPPRVLLNINGANQLRTLTFGGTGTFSRFDEIGSVASTQNIGRAAVFDVTGGFRILKHVGVALGGWTTTAKSAVTGSAMIPDPLVYAQPVSAIVSAEDLRQRTIGLTVQAVGTIWLVERLSVAVFAGPAFVHVRQDVGSVSIADTSQTATIALATESARTAKAASAGLDVAWMVNERSGLGFVVRYVAGEVDLPSAPKMKVGGLQVGAGLRFRFR